jgi:CheY-like chemotaxis protein
MDFSMQARLNGRDAIAHLRTVFPLGALRVIGISSDSRMNRLMLEAGADDAVVKMTLPERFRELLESDQE